MRPLDSSLKTRLVLAFLALVSLILFVGVTSYSVNRRMHTRVVELRSNRVIDLRRVDLTAVGLEFEGFWNPAGSFVASDVEFVPAADRPRLRGEVQGVEAERRTVRVFGRRIQVPEDCEWADSPERPVPFERLRPGQRIEVTCSVHEGAWQAEKLSLEHVKSSDKVKGTVTAAEIDGVAPDSVEIHDLVIVLEPVTTEGPESALGHIELATQLVLTLQECSAASMDVIEGRGREDSEKRLTGAVEHWVDLVELGHAQPAGAEGDLEPLQVADQTYLRLLRQMSAAAPRLRAEAQEILAAAPGDARAALDLARSRFEPLVEEELLSLAYAYLSTAEESLGDDLREVLEGTTTTTRVALVTSLVAAVLAFVLGGLVWRSVHGPIRRLHDAALRLGAGHLDTRVDVDSRDELGVLAGAFNKMASELAATTVSMESLENVFDSMAGALILLDPAGAIVNVNRATLALTGRDRSELIGQGFDVVCPSCLSDVLARTSSARGSSFEAVERVFSRKDGSEVPVSLSGAELRSAGGPLQGYVCVALDLSDQKRIQERLSDSLEEKEMLLREVHHRVKNNMQVISSLLAMQSTGGHPEVERKLEESQSRIRSIALIHEQLYRSSELVHIDARDYLEDLTSQLVQSLGHGAVTIALQVDPLDLDIDQSLACGLIVNELVTNAIKYAYPEGTAGEIRVSLRASGDACILTVADDGPGLSDNGAATAEGSLGRHLVATLARQLNGRVETDGARGTEVRIHFPGRQAAAQAS